MLLLDKSNKLISVETLFDQVTKEEQNFFLTLEEELLKICEFYESKSSDNLYNLIMFI